MIMDIVYFLVADRLRDNNACYPGLSPFSQNTIYEYLDTVLDYEDMHLEGLLADRLYQMADELLRSEGFACFLDGTDEVLDVQYRHAYGEKYVKFFVTIGKVEQSIAPPEVKTFYD